MPEVMGRSADRYRDLVINDRLEPGQAVDLTVIVVTHESANDIRQCLESTRNITKDTTFEVVVVDNQSLDGTAEVVAQEFPAVRLIRKRGRHGFSINSNIGVAASAGRLLLFFNPDASLQPGAVERLIEHLEAHPEVGVLGPRLVFPDGSPQPSARRFPALGATIVRRTPLRWLMRDSASERRHLMLDEAPVGDEGARDVDWLLGAALLMRADTYRGLGGFDDRYRLYCEDIDLCWRVHAAGLRVRLLGTATVTHDLGELTRRRFFKRATLWHFRSMARYVRLHGLRRPPSPPSGTGPGDVRDPSRRPR